MRYPVVADDSARNGFREHDITNALGQLGQCLRDEAAAETLIVGIPQRPQLPIRLRDVHSPHRLRSIALRTQFLLQPLEPSSNASFLLFNLLKGDPIDARCPIVLSGLPVSLLRKHWLRTRAIAVASTSAR